MRRVRVYGLTLAAVVCPCLQTTVSVAQDDDLPRTGNGGGVRGFLPDDDFASHVLAGSSRAALPEEFRDSAFDHYVQLTMISEAIAARDASLLADIALQLAQAERILLRKHRSGLLASTLLGKAAKLASDTRDKATLDRVRIAAESLQDKELAGQIKTMERLVGSSRAATPAISVQIEEIDAQALVQIKGWLDTIRAAEVVVDLDSLRVIRSELETSDVLNGEQKAAIVKQIDAAVAASPEPDAQDALLLKLTGASRPHNRGERESPLRARFGSCIVFGGEYSAMTAVLTALDVYATGGGCSKEFFEREARKLGVKVADLMVRCKYNPSRDRLYTGTMIISNWETVKYPCPTVRNPRRMCERKVALPNKFVPWFAIKKG